MRLYHLQPVLKTKTAARWQLSSRRLCRPFFRPRRLALLPLSSGVGRGRFVRARVGLPLFFGLTLRRARPVLPRRDGQRQFGVRVLFHLRDLRGEVDGGENLALALAARQPLVVVYVRRAVAELDRDFVRRVLDHQTDSQSVLLPLNQLILGLVLVYVE